MVANRTWWWPEEDLLDQVHKTNHKSQCCSLAIYASWYCFFSSSKILTVLVTVLWFPLPEVFLQDFLMRKQIFSWNCLTLVFVYIMTNLTGTCTRHNWDEHIAGRVQPRPRWPTFVKCWDGICWVQYHQEKEQIWDRKQFKVVLLHNEVSLDSGVVPNPGSICLEVRQTDPVVPATQRWKIRL